MFAGTGTGTAASMMAVERLRHIWSDAIAPQLDPTVGTRNPAGIGIFMAGGALQFTNRLGAAGGAKFVITLN